MSSNSWLGGALFAAALLVDAVARAGAPISVTPITLPEMPQLSAPQASVPAPPPDLSAFEGKPVHAAEVVQDEDPWDDIKPPILRSIHLGDPFRADMARAALLEATRTGLYGTAKVNMIPEGDGVRIRVHAVPRRVIDALRVDTHGAPLDREEILREAQLEEGGEILGSDVGTRKRRIEVMFAHHGYPQAQVDFSTRQTDSPTRISLLVDVNAGRPQKIGRRVFYPFGARAEDLAPYTKPYEVDEGDRVDEGALQQADVALENRLRTAGYYDAGVKHDLVLARYPNGSVITLRVRIDSGPRYFTRFDGNVHYDADALQTALGLDTDPDTGEQHLAEKLRRFYVARGFLDAQIAFDLRGKGEEPSRFIVFHVREGERVGVVQRQYPCVRNDAIKNLSGGGPSSASAIGRELDSFLDEDLPGADLIARSRSARRRQGSRRGAGTRVVADRSRAERDVLARDVRQRHRARAGALSKRGLLERARRARAGHAARGAIRSRRPAAASPCRSRSRSPTRARTTAAGCRSRSRRSIRASRACPTRSAASSASRT